MTVMEEYVTKTAAVLGKDPVHDVGCQSVEMSVPCDCGYHPSTLEQRIAIGLMQARALECRFWAGKLQVNFPTNPFAVWLAGQLMDRSHKLETVGLAMCRVYPPETDTKVEQPPMVTLQ